MAVHLGYFALREFVLKRQWRFLRPFLGGLRLGLSRPLKPFPRIEDRCSIELAPHQG
jgi:hypothetical protein